MRINKDKSIGTVILIVEGQKFELSLLKWIFVDILGYEYHSKKRGKKNYYDKGKEQKSKVFVVNSSSSNLNSIEDKDYRDKLYEEITEQYQIDIDDAAVFYLFDRDPKSNTNSDIYNDFHKKYIDPWDNPDNENGGQLLLSYPSFESYEVGCFCDNAYLLEYGVGKKLKEYMALENNAKMYQLNKMNEEAIKHATSEFFKYIQVLGHKVDMNNLNVLPYQVYKEQESFYKDNNSLYRLASLFTVMFLQLGIIELDEEFPDIYIPPQY